MVFLIATFSMILDHFALLYLPKESLIYIIFRIIGRLALPLFLDSIITGIQHTKSNKKYFIRLGLFFIISQPISLLVLNKNSIGLDLILTYIQILIFNRLHFNYWMLITYCISILSYFIHTQYSFYLPWLILFIYGYNWLIISISTWKSINIKYTGIRPYILIISSIIVTFYYCYIYNNYLQFFTYLWIIFIVSPLTKSNTFINFPCTIKYKFVKIPYYIKYSIYPLHLLLLYLFKFT